MNETRKTGAFVGIALLLLALAVVAGQPARSTSREFAELGQPFFPNFTLPEQAKSLRVVAYDADTGEPRPFSVAFREGRWIIPSHYSYPADAQDRLARTAAGLIDLKKETIRSDRSEDHKALGVLDPLDAQNLGLDGLGERVTLEDASGRSLADLILGKPDPERPGFRFVRVPGQNRVYGARLDGVEISTRFADWIEPNLLELSPESIFKVAFDTHKVDVQRQQVDEGELIVAQRKNEPLVARSATPAAPRWEVDGGVPVGKVVNDQALDTMTSTLGSLRIVGVRPKPPGLTAELKGEPQMRLNEDDVASLARRGFYLLNDRLLPSEGVVYATTDEGIIYSLRFGNVTFERGEALSAGSPDESAVPTGTEKPSASAIESRYLFVTASFDPRSVPPPIGLDAAGELPTDPFAKAPADRTAEAKRETDRRAAERAAYEKRQADGKAKAKALSDRFAGWYYVVPGDAFRRISLDRASLARDPAADPPARANPFEGMPGFPGGGAPGLPGGGGFGRPGMIAPPPR